jgi:hypothetical protein
VAHGVVDGLWTLRQRPLVGDEPAHLGLVPAHDLDGLGELPAGAHCGAERWVAEPGGYVHENPGAIHTLVCENPPG